MMPLVRTTDTHPKRQAIAIGIINVEIAHAIGAITRRLQYHRAVRLQLVVERIDCGHEDIDGALPGPALGLVRGLKWMVTSSRSTPP